jgi:hypothetical protein
MTRFLVLALAPIAVFSTTSAHAQQRPLVHPDGGKTVIVWKNEKAHSEGVALISAGRAER